MGQGQGEWEMWGEEDMGWNGEKKGKKEIM